MMLDRLPSALALLLDRAPAGSPAVADPRLWRRFVLFFAAAAIGLGAVVATTLLALDPYDSGRFALFGDHDVPHTGQRLAGASLGRQPGFDTAIRRPRVGAAVGWLRSAPPFNRRSRESGTQGPQRSVACPGCPLSRAGRCRTISPHRDPLKLRARFDYLRSRSNSVSYDGTPRLAPMMDRVEPPRPAPNGARTGFPDRSTPCAASPKGVGLIAKGGAMNEPLISPQRGLVYLGPTRAATATMRAVA